MSAWIEIKSYTNRMQAELAKSVLENAEIKVEIRVDQVNGLIHYLAMAAGIGLMVPREQAEQANKILQDFK